MAFNWFRRQFTPPENASELAAESDVIGESTPEPVPTEAETAPEDYLAWAKAAYQSIQEKQQSSVVSEEGGALEATGLSSVDPTAASVALAPVTPAGEFGDTDRPALLDQLNATAIEGDLTPNRATPPPVAPKLKMPVAAPEPEAMPKSAEAIAFDDGFLWSAEVLAAQGRKPEDVAAQEVSWLQKLRQGLGKTRRGVVNQIKAIVGQGPLSQDAVTEIESLLLMADVGVEATDKIVEALQAKMRQETLPPDAAIAYLKKILRDILDEPTQSKYSAVFAPEKNTLNIWLMTGVNGAGKTTTIGKIAHIATESGFNCLVAAADTFRAAAVQQVKVWAQRSDVEVIANPGQNTDPAAVVFDAITAAQSRNTELLLVDTAGRLQNKKNLMDELRKVRQVIEKKAPQAKVESLLVLDATLGQNGLRQAQVFSEAAQLSGVVLTKLDGSAKGGIALAVVQQLGLPIRFIGAGEGIGDLRPFSSYEFVEALLGGE